MSFSISSLSVISSNQPKAVILGAGPAGLSCALDAIKNGYHPIIIEQRSREAKGRINPVYLYQNVINQLETHHLYSDLLQQGLIFPMDNNKCTVRLTDLEKCMTKYLEKSDTLIRYNESVLELVERGEKTDLILKSGQVIEQVDLVVNAEGWHSSTNTLLVNRRIEVLSEQQAVYSILREDAAPVTDLKTFLMMSAKSMRTVAVAIRDHTIYLFLLIFTREHFFSSRKQIAIAATLKTPGQHRVGFAFTRQKNQELQALMKKVEAGKATGEQVEEMLRFWSRMALCEVNLFALLAKIGRLFGRRDIQLSAAWPLPIESTNLVNFRTDRVENAAIVRNKTLFLMAGDALATVDPSAVLGCNTAIELSPHIQQALSDLKEGAELPKIAGRYAAACNQLIDRNHQIAYKFRKRFDSEARNLELDLSLNRFLPSPQAA